LQFRTRLIAPPAALAGLVNTFYIIETEAERIIETIPAYSAQLIVVVRGAFTITYADGRSARSAPVTLNAPQLRSAAVKIDGPAVIVGASFTHTSWQAFANLPADEIHDQLIPAHAVMTVEQIERLTAAAQACADGRITPDALCAPLGEAIAEAPFPPRADQAATVQAILAWLSSGFDPALDDLYAAVSISPRQVQRICRRYFGVAPAQVLKRFRALRALMLLAQPGIDPSVADALMATYFDQAHLIRDFRRYTGRTPTQWRQWSVASALLDPAAHGEAGALLRPARRPDGPAPG
jgi:AraC-like DNA-binding protein